MIKPGDWLAWMIQFALGLVVGVPFSGIFVIEGRRGTRVIPPEHTFPLVAGLALLGAALVSWFGDRLWLRYDSLTDRDQRPAYHNHATRIASIAAGCLGIALITVSFLRTAGFGT